MKPVALDTQSLEARKATYLRMIENSVGSKQYRTLYAVVDGVLKDITGDGRLSCAYFVSSVLHAFGLADSVHATITGTLEDMERNGWYQLYCCGRKPGQILVWREEEGHKHIGFYLGRPTGRTCVSTSPREHVVVYHDITYDDQRWLHEIYTHNFLHD